MAIRIINKSSTPLPLFEPYRRVVAPGGSIIVSRTEAQVIADLGDLTHIRLEDASDSDADLITIVSAAPDATQPVNEVFFQDNVAAAQAAVALGVRGRTTFVDGVIMPRAGSIVGLVVRYNAAVTTDTGTVIVTIDGTPGTLSLASSSGSNPSGGVVTQAPGIDVFAAGEKLSLDITTGATFAPITTDMEAWLEVSLKTAA